LAFFGPSAPTGDTIVNYIAFLSPAYDGAGLGLQNLYWTFFARGTFWELDFVSVIFVHVSLRILTFRERQRPLLKI